MSQRVVWQVARPLPNEPDDVPASLSLYQTLFTNENSTGVPQHLPPPAPLLSTKHSNNKAFELVFAENKTRNDGTKSLNERQSEGAAPNGRNTMRGRDDGNYYITSVNARRNPDLIIPGGAIRGNMYFRRHIDPNKDEEE